jgi:hypothetical protein
LLDKGNHVAQGANPFYRLRLGTQELARRGHEQSGFDVKQSDSLTTELSSNIELIAAHRPRRDGQLSVEIINRVRIIGESLSGGRARSAGLTVA